MSPRIVTAGLAPAAVVLLGFLMSGEGGFVFQPTTPPEASVATPATPATPPPAPPPAPPPPPPGCSLPLPSGVIANDH